MDTRTLMACCAGAFAFAVWQPAGAAPCGGYDVHATISSETFEVAKGHSLTISKDHSTVITTDPKSIYNQTLGMCAGTFMALPDGRVQGSGHCLRKDKDGDTESLEWGLAPGAERGTWKITGGTGKFAGRTDSGWWQMGPGDGTRYITLWGGECR